MLLYPLFCFDIQQCCRDCAEGHRAPVFTVVGCEGKLSIPSVQYYELRDALLEKWDDTLGKLLQHSRQEESQWPSKREQAVFRGGIRSASSPWRQWGRARLLLARNSFDGELLNISFDNFPFAIPSAEAANMTVDVPVRLSLDDQETTFKYVIYAEGNCGWADRLKYLLARGMLILKQETDCNEYYGYLLRPWVHYVPVSNDFSNLTAAVRWAKEHDEEARAIIRNANQFAMEYLRVDAMVYYTRNLLLAYQRLLRYSPQRTPHSIPYTGCRASCTQHRCQPSACI